MKSYTWLCTLALLALVGCSSADAERTSAAGAAVAVDESGLPDSAGLALESAGESAQRLLCASRRSGDALVDVLVLGLRDDLAERPQRDLDQRHLVGRPLAWTIGIGQPDVDPLHVSLVQAQG